MTVRASSCLRSSQAAASTAISTVFLGLFAVNMVILAFDFPRTTSLTLFFFVAALVMGLVLLFTFHPTLLPAITHALAAFRPLANATFYWTVAGTLGAILTDQGVYRFGPKDGDPSKTVSRVLGPVRDIAFGQDGALYALEANRLTALDRGGAVLWTAPLTDGRRLLAAARTVVLDGPDRLLVVGPGGALDELGAGGAIQDVAVSLGGRRIAAVVDSKRALLFELP